MICQSTYDSLEAIPETLRDEFEQKNGKWQLKDSAIPGVGQLFNSALAANEAKAVDQVKTRNTRIRELETENARLNDQIGVYQQPGSVILSKEDSQTWDKYTKLGSVKDIEAKLGEFETLQEKATRLELSESLGKISKEIGVNHEVLADWATSSEGKGVSFFTKDVTVKDAKGVETVKKMAMVKIETLNGTKTEVTEQELIPFAKERMPEWKFNALTATQEPAQRQSAPAGVTLPSMGSVTNTPAVTQGERPVDKFNAERGAKRNPFLPSSAKV